MKDGIPATAFESTAIQREVERLKEKGVAFTMEPTVARNVTLTIFSDTCRNLIQIYQPTT